MKIQDIPVITVSYNTPDFIRNLLTSFRAKYPNPYYIIDGSDPENLEEVRKIASEFKDVEVIGFGYNIHHGPGMSWAIQNLPIKGPVLFLDSDMEIIHGGFLESLAEKLEPGMYGVGGMGYTDRNGFDISYRENAIQYLHPGCMLCNMDVVRQWPLPIKHGAPMIEAMLALHDSGQPDLIGNVEWVLNDVRMGTEKIYLDHKGQGTVVKTGGYHLEEWSQKVQEQNKKPNYSAGLDSYNRDLLAFIPENARHVVEVGCNCGALAAAYKAINPGCTYDGIELDKQAAQAARDHCDKVLELDVESVGTEFFGKFSQADCWVFGDVLEHLKDPWQVLARIRSVIPEDGMIVACISNAQHWSVQAKLSIGDFRYQDGGLMDRTHLRWFTRATIFELFAQAGFQVVAGKPRIFDEPMRDQVMPAIRLMAQLTGADPDVAANDSLPLQYIVRAVPVTSDGSNA